MTAILKTYSELVGRQPTLAENEYRAENNDMVAHRVDNDAVAIHAEFPTVKLCTYNLHRLIPPNDAALWNSYAGAGAEAGYIHHAGVRRQLPIGGLAGYYVMNMGHAPYVAWQAMRAVKSIEGTLYNPPLYNPPGQHDGFNMDAVQVDLTMWYAAFDPLHEEILTSTEYAGNGNAYAAACVAAFVTVKNAVIAAHPGSTVFPNFGDLSFCALTDANTLALIAASTLIEAQQAFTYSNGEPSLNAASCEARWATIAALSGKDLLAHGLLITPQTQAAKDRAKIATAAWFLMAARAGLYARFATDVDAAADISTWEQPDLLRAAASELGSALGPYQKVTGGAWTKGEVYHREFASGRAYLFVRKAGQVGSETAVLNIPSSQPFLMGGGFGHATTTLSLTLGEGAVLKNADAAIEGRSPIRICEGASPIGPPVSGIAPIEGTVEGSAHFDNE